MRFPLYLCGNSEKYGVLRKRFELFIYLTYNKLRIDMKRAAKAHKELMF